MKIGTLVWVFNYEGSKRNHLAIVTESVEVEETHEDGTTETVNYLDVFVFDRGAMLHRQTNLELAS